MKRLLPSLMGIKANSTKTFLIKDKSNLVKIKQPDVMDVALLYGVLLEKTNINIIDKKLDLFWIYS